MIGSCRIWYVMPVHCTIFNYTCSKFSHGKW